MLHHPCGRKRHPGCAIHRKVGGLRFAWARQTNVRVDLRLTQIKVVFAQLNFSFFWFGVCDTVHGTPHCTAVAMADADNFRSRLSPPTVPEDVVSYKVFLVPHEASSADDAVAPAPRAVPVAASAPSAAAVAPSEAALGRSTSTSIPLRGGVDAAPQAGTDAPRSVGAGGAGAGSRAASATAAASAPGGDAVPPSASPALQRLQDVLVDARQAAAATVASTGHLWQRQPFCLGVQRTGDAVGHCLAGRTAFGDNVEDEWLVVHLLMALTVRHHDVVVQVVRFAVVVGVLLLRACVRV